MHDDVKVMKGERNEASTHSIALYLVFPRGGTAYAQSVEDKAPVDQPKIQQEAVSTPR